MLQIGVVLEGERGTKEVEGLLGDPLKVEELTINVRTFFCDCIDVGIEELFPMLDG